MNLMILLCVSSLINVLLVVALIFTNKKWHDYSVALVSSWYEMCKAMMDVENDEEGDMWDYEIEEYCEEE